MKTLKTIKKKSIFPQQPIQTKTFNQSPNQISVTRSKFAIRTLYNNGGNVKNNNINNSDNDNNNRIVWTATRQIGTSINRDEFDPRRSPRKFATPLPPLGSMAVLNWMQDNASPSGSLCEVVVFGFVHLKCTNPKLARLGGDGIRLNPSIITSGI